jgi:hypothetical protein
MDDNDGCSGDELSKEDESEQTPDKLFACPNEGCVQVYQRYGSMVNHVTFGHCKLKLERESMSLLDKSKITYSKNLLGGDTTTVIPCIKASTVNPLANSQTNLKQGWALKASKKTTNFSEKQKTFLEEKFMVGETTGKKLNPSTVAKQMRVARGSDQERIFSPEEYLSANQIQGFFSRRAKSKTKGSLGDKDYCAAEVEDSLTRIRNEVLEETEPRHPLTFDGYNLCELVAANKLTKHTLSVLKGMCDFFELDVHAKSARRKAPYVEALHGLIASCSCSM